MPSDFEARLAEIMARHYARQPTDLDGVPDGPMVCKECYQPFPCDASWLADRAEVMRAALVRILGEPIGLSDATDREVLKGCEDIARDALAEAEREP